MSSNFPNPNLATSKKIDMSLTAMSDKEFGGGSDSKFHFLDRKGFKQERVETLDSFAIIDHRTLNEYLFPFAYGR